ncbi:hypothetical protein CEXT_566681 [Caerostris extrusa]|uniref:Uncharacterized protein n=1 Tax=Caerostris extrusa TaxID=172846 RepID=A0AAV4WM48_CAEEX|nr:hypothetical protein CEXT_566681 [Caerostris extrusa]
MVLAVRTRAKKDIISLVPKLQLGLELKMMIKAVVLRRVKRVHQWETRCICHPNYHRDSSFMKVVMLRDGDGDVNKFGHPLSRMITELVATGYQIE